MLPIFFTLWKERQELAARSGGRAKKPKAKPRPKKSGQ
jgi:hypothetical protein